jgi:hypothetical protein
MTRWLSLGLSVALAACASPPPGLSPQGSPISGEAHCQALAHKLGAAVSTAGVGDAQAVMIEGFDWLRVDRFTAALGRQDTVSTQPAAWLERLRELDAQARRIELANLPDERVTWLASAANLKTPTSDAGSRLQPDDAGSARLALQTRVDSCGRASIAAIAQEPETLDRLRRSAQVPDDYVDWRRALGVYPLSALAFQAGVRREEAAMAAAHARHADAVALDARLMVIERAPTDAQGDDGSRIANFKRDALGVPRPDDRQAIALLARHAPVIALAGRTVDDRIGTLQLDALGRSVVDTSRPAVYGRISFMHWQGEIRVQLVYTAWFPRRPPAGRADLLAGHLDGIMLRLTLDADERIDMIDSIHPCGCWHQFIPVGDWQVQPAPAPREEWAFVARRLASVPAGHRVRIRVSAGAHMLEGIDSVERLQGIDQSAPIGSVTAASIATVAETPDTSLVASSRPGAGAGAGAAGQGPDHYTLLPDDGLRSLALPSGGRRSLYDPRGFVPGTDRAEAWLFWPMGIADAGAMRQWGHHATAFVGRRHFDDADLLERRFVRPAGSPARLRP